MEIRSWTRRGTLRDRADVVLFLILLTAIGWGLVQGAIATGYRWNWGRVWRYVAVETERGWTPGPLLNGLQVTLVLVVCSFVLMLVVGAVAAMAARARSPVARALARLYVEGARNTPLLVQLYVFYFIVAPVFGIDRFWSAVLALALFEGAFAAEILRAGFRAVPVGQSDAAAALGLTRWLAMRRVILPQALRVVLPPLTGQSVSLIKDSALVGVIALYDLTAEARSVIANSLMTFEIWLIVAAVYIVLALILSGGAGALERALRLPGQHPSTGS